MVLLGYGFLLHFVTDKYAMEKKMQLSLSANDALKPQSTLLNKFYLICFFFFFSLLKIFKQSKFLFTVYN